jgi:hypothetical protein
LSKYIKYVPGVVDFWPRSLQRLLVCYRQNEQAGNGRWSSSVALVLFVDLHPTAIKRFKQNLEQISAAKGQLDPQVAASFRELIDGVVVICVG